MKKHIKKLTSILCKEILIVFLFVLLFFIFQVKDKYIVWYEESPIITIAFTVCITLFFLLCIIWPLEKIREKFLNFFFGPENTKKSFYHSIYFIGVLSGALIIIGTLIENQKTNIISEKGRLDQRFTEAIKLLGNENDFIALSGLMSLHEVANDAFYNIKKESGVSGEDYVKKVARIYCHYLRENSKIEKKTGSILLYKGNGTSLNENYSYNTGSNKLNHEFIYFIFNSLFSSNSIYKQCISTLDLYGCVIEGVSFGDLDFSDIEIKSVIFKNVLFAENANFQNTLFNNVYFNDVYFISTHFDNVRIGNSTFKDCLFYENTINTAVFPNSVFISAYFYDCNLNHFNLTSCRFVELWFGKINFHKSKLSNMEGGSLYVDEYSIKKGPEHVGLGNTSMETIKILSDEEIINSMSRLSLFKNISIFHY